MLFYIVFRVPAHGASWQLKMSLPPYGHRTTWYQNQTHSNILTSAITDPVCKSSSNRDNKDPEGFQLQENPCTTDSDQSLSYESLKVTTHN